MEEEEEMDPINVLDQSMRYSILEKTFENLDVAYNFYKGFGIRKNQVNRRKKTDEIYRRIFVCNKQVYKDMNDKRHLGDDVKRRCIVRTGCEAMMQVTLSDHGEWVVDKFISKHNHPLDPPSHVLKQRSHCVFHRSHKCKDVVTLSSKAEEKNMRKKARAESDTNNSSGGMSGTQVEESQPDVLVLDLIVRVKTKGRPKVATRIKLGMEASMNSKKQKACSYCRGT
nr:protein FAR1-related sequence 5-like [Tanacetum cinerariifolium]